MSDARHKQYRRSEWLDPRIELRHSSIAGRGMFARSAISKGETVIVWGGGTVILTNGRIVPRYRCQGIKGTTGGT